MTIEDYRSRVRPNNLSLSELVRLENAAIDEREARERRAKDDEAYYLKVTGQHHLRSHHDGTGVIEGSRQDWRKAPPSSARDSALADEALERRIRREIAEARARKFQPAPVLTDDDILLPVTKEKAPARAVHRDDLEWGAGSVRGAGTMRCSATTKRGTNCQSYALTNGLCRIHGLTPEELSEQSRQGGVMSGEVRRFKKAGYEPDGMGGYRRPLDRDSAIPANDPPVQGEDVNAYRDA